MKTKEKNIPNNNIPSRLAILLIIFFAMIGFFSIYLIFNKNQNTQFSDKNISTKKINSFSKNTAKDSSNSAQSKVDVYRPVPSGNQLRIPILYYHYIGNNPNPADLQRNALSISPDKFDEQMGYLKNNGYTTISLDTLYAALKNKASISNKSVILTFDDGYIDFFYNAYPILRKYGFSATVFIPTGLMGRGAYLTWSQIKEMSSSGFILFGSHSVHHYSLISLSKEIMINEITESKRVLQEQLGIPINFMAYPYGSTNSQVISEVIKAGFIGAVGTWPGREQSEGTIYNMPRIRISGAISLETFAGLL